MQTNDAFTFFPGKGVYTTPNSGLEPVLEIFDKDVVTDVFAVFSCLATEGNKINIGAKYSSEVIQSAEKLLSLHGKVNTPRNQVREVNVNLRSFRKPPKTNCMRTMLGNSKIEWEHIEKLLREEGYILRKREYQYAGVEKLAPVYVVSHTEKGVISEGKGLTEDQSIRSALAEAVERLFAIPEAKTIVVGSQSELLPNTNNRSHITTGPRDTFSQDIVTEWLPAKDLITDTSMFLPAEISGFDYVPKIPRLRNFALHHTTGLSVGTSIEDATLSGLLEVLERDAYWITMRCKINHPNIDLSSVQNVDPGTISIVREYRKQGFEVVIKDMSLDWGIPIAHAVLVDNNKKIPAFAHGSGAALDWPTAISRAVTEVVQMHSGMAELMSDPDKWERLVSVNDVLGRGELAWSDPLFETHIRHCIEASKKQFDEGDTKIDTPEKLLMSLKNKGYSVVVAPIKQVCGLHVVRVFVPEATQPDERLERTSERMELFKKANKLPAFYCDPILT